MSNLFPKGYGDGTGVSEGHTDVLGKMEAVNTRLEVVEGAVPGAGRYVLPTVEPADETCPEGELVAWLDMSTPAVQMKLRSEDIFLVGSIALSERSEL